MLARAILADVVRAALGPDADRVEYRVVAGQAGRGLIDAARREDAGLIVLAARGSGVPALAGAVSQYVLRHAPCPVLVVPEASKDG